MHAHRPHSPLRLRKVIPAIIAPLLPLVIAAAGVVSGAAQQQARSKKAEVRIGPGEMDGCGPNPISVSGRECLRGKVMTITGEQRGMAMRGGRAVEGELFSTVKVNYDERGNRTLMVGSGPAGLPDRRDVYSYDTQGRMIGVEYYEAGRDAPKGVTAYSYDERGNRVKMDSTRTEPDARVVQEFSYDAEGREVGGSVSQLTAGVWQTRTHKTVVTIEGKTTHSRSYSSDGVLRGRVTTLKDDRGNTLGEELYRVAAGGEEQLRWKVTYRYDEKGFLREVFYHKADDWLGARAVYEYDERGNVTSLKRYHGDGTFAVGGHREYEYDAAGNWVKRITSHWLSENGPAQPYRVERRHITYY
ncbi:MAG: hypothetical protein ABW250_20155 [Pyrinomonadaceae bacterium]